MARKISSKQSTEEYKATYALLQARVARLSDARRVAEEHYDRLRAAPDWQEFCDANNITADGDFGDLMA